MDDDHLIEVLTKHGVTKCKARLSTYYQVDHDFIMQQLDLPKNGMGLVFLGLHIRTKSHKTY